MYLSNNGDMYGMMITTTMVEEPNTGRYRVRAFDKNGDKNTFIGYLDTNTARFSGAQEARERINEALKDEGALFPTVRVEIYVEDVVCSADINRNIGAWVY